MWLENRVFFQSVSAFFVQVVHGCWMGAPSEVVVDCRRAEFLITAEYKQPSPLTGCTSLDGTFCLVMYLWAALG